MASSQYEEMIFQRVWHGKQYCGQYLQSFQIRYTGIDGWSLANIREGPTKIYWYK